MLDAAHAADFACVEAFELAAEYRAFLDRRLQHAGQGEVRGVDHLPRDLVDGVEAVYGFADQFPVFRVFQHHILGLRLRDLCRCFGNLAIGGGAAARAVSDDAVGSAALGGRYFPFIGRSLDQHHACDHATASHVVMRLANTAATTG